MIPTTKRPIAQTASMMMEMEKISPPLPGLALVAVILHRPNVTPIVTAKTIATLERVLRGGGGVNPKVSLGGSGGVLILVPVQCPEKCCTTER
jgi:hypothetical protein